MAVLKKTQGKGIARVWWRCERVCIEIFKCKMKIVCSCDSGGNYKYVRGWESD